MTFPRRSFIFKDHFLLSLPGADSLSAWKKEVFAASAQVDGVL